MFDDIKFDMRDEVALENIRSRFNEQMVKDEVRKALLFCFLGLPSERKNVDDIDNKFLELVNDVLADLHEQGMNYFANF